MNRIKHYFKENFHYCPRCQAKLAVVGDHFECPACHFPLYPNPAASVGLIICQAQQILLAQRKIAPYANYWDIIGGFIEPGESAEQACHREMLEETGGVIELTGYLGSKTDYYSLHEPTICFNFTAKLLIESDQLLANDDVQALQWFPVSDLPAKIAFKSVRATLAEFCQQFTN